MAKDLAPLDRLFSEYIRRRAMARFGGCERCRSSKNTWTQLQCAHFHGRSSKSVRWDEDNAAGLCGGCHRYLDSHPMEKVEWFRQHLGQDAFDQLNVRYLMMGMPDLNLLGVYYRRKLEEL